MQRSKDSGQQGKPEHSNNCVDQTFAGNMVAAALMKKKGCWKVDNRVFFATIDCNIMVIYKVE